MKHFVVSGVGMTEGGILTVLREILRAAETELDSSWKIIALVHSESLFESYDRVQFIEFPKVKASWVRRIIFELFTSHRLSKELKADIWFCAHDMTARVARGAQFVYAHNPSSFKSPDVRDLRFDWVFFVHSLLYRFVYGFRISRNTAVFVQQKWIALEFKRRYGGVTLCVARPFDRSDNSTRSDEERERSQVLNWIYPTFPRHFKNIELACEAAKLLQVRNKNINVTITISGTENKYARYIFKSYGRLKNVNFIGLQDKKELDQVYTKMDGVLFPSKLETWGLPLSEAMERKLYVLAADLPYAREVVGGYEDSAFFNSDDPAGLAAIMDALALDRTSVVCSNSEVEYFSPMVEGWSDLIRYVLDCGEASDG